MRSVVQSLSAVGQAPWVPLNYSQLMFNVGLSVVTSSNITGLTAVVQFTADDPNPMSASVIQSITRAATVATLVSPNHRLSVADSIVVAKSGDPNLDGTYQVATVVDQNTITYTVANTGITASQGGMQAALLRVFGVTGLTAVAARTYAAVGTPIRAVRLTVSAIATGSVDLTVLQGLGSA